MPGYVRLLQIRDFSSDDLAVYIEDSGRWPKCEESDILIGRYGASVGRVLTGKSGAYNVALVKVLFNKNALASSWVLRFFQSDHFQGPIKLLSRSAQNGFNKRDLSSISFLLPPLNEQRRIVERIESLQSRTRKARNALDAIPPLIEKFRQSVLASAFRGDLTADWRAQNPDVEPASVLLERIRKQTLVRKLRRGIPEGVRMPASVKSFRYPDSWKLLAVADLLRAGALIDVKDGNHGANHPISKEFVANGLPFVTAAQVKADYTVDYDGAPKLAGPPLDKLRVGFSEPRDTIFTHKGTIGRTALNTRSCVLTPQTTYYRCNERVLWPEYLMYYISAWQYYVQYSQIMSQTTRNFVPITAQYELFVVLPPLAEQKEIALRVERQVKLINALQIRVLSDLSTITTLDQSILAKAFRGELVPQDPNDEPASVLLERIRAEKAAQQPQKKRRRRSRG